MLQKIIKNGENEKTEFKETFRYDVKADSKNRALKKEVIKAICGLLNYQGGSILIGVKDDCQIMGLKRDLLLYKGESEVKNRDNLLKDVNTVCREYLGTRVIGLLTITYESIEDEEIILIEVLPSDEPVFHQDKVFYLRNGPETIQLEGRELTDYVLKRFGKPEPDPQEILVQPVAGLDERVKILKKFIKNLMIEYYREGKLGESFDPNINLIIYKIARIINNFDNTTLNEYIRGTSTKPNYRKLSTIFFGVNLDSFINKIINQELDLDPISRPKLVLAGDIAYLMKNWMELTPDQDSRLLSQIYGLVDYRRSSFRTINFSSIMTPAEFLEAIEVLIQQKLIDLSNIPNKSNLEKTSWQIKNELRLINFYQSRSIFFLLDQQEIIELTMERNGHCIRCNKPIDLNTESPFCYWCYRSWAKYHNWNYQEQYCHSCGELAPTTRSKPLCDDCYFGEN